jgi:hypothetical protein
MKVFEKMLLDRIEDKEKYKQKFIDDIMEGVIEITFPDGTVEKQEPCPLFWEHVKPLIGRDRVIEEVCAEIGECNARKCWRKYFELEVNE